MTNQPIATDDKKSDSKKKDNIEKIINDCYAQSNKYSALLSTNFRQLAFAFGALFWFAKITFNTSNLVIICGYFSIVLFFSFDALQYYLGLRHFEKIARQFQHDLEVHKILDENMYKVTPTDNIDAIFYVKLIIIILSFFILFYSLIVGMSSQESLKNYPQLSIPYIHIPQSTKPVFNQ